MTKKEKALDKERALDRFVSHGDGIEVHGDWSKQIEELQKRIEELKKSSKNA